MSTTPEDNSGLVAPANSPFKVIARRRPRGRNGRRIAIALIDALLEEPDNIHQLAVSLQEKFDDDPVAFVKDIALPLTPKTMMEEDTGNAPEDKAQEIRENLAVITQGTFNAAPPVHTVIQDPAKAANPQK